MSEPGDETARRRARIAEAIAAHRRAGSESPVRFAADDAAGPDESPVTYRDREIVVRLDEHGSERARLDAVLDDFPVFKISQPETRKAPDGEVHVSAIADPKHAADFVDRLFRDVYGAVAEYDLTVDDA